MAVPPPPPPGITWRPVRADDPAAVAALVREVHRAERLEYVGGPEFWTWWLGQHDLAADTMMAEDASGTPVGIAGSHRTDTDRGARAILWLDAHPDHLDLEGPLLAWAAARGREQVAASSHPDKAVRVSVEEHRARRRSLLEEAGFAPARTFVEMRRSLGSDLPATPAAPAGISVTPWSPDLDEAARLASNAAFAGHWGSLPMGPREWAGTIMDDDTVRRDLSFVALAGDDAAGICLAEVDREEDPSRVWISRVGTVPSRQRRGIATLLLATSLHAAAAAGLASAALEVDEQSRYDATAVYARLGFTVAARSITYLLEGVS